jgi:uncharacterized SAM-binding protein YcdF (DUF218 family)
VSLSDTLTAVLVPPFNLLPLSCAGLLITRRHPRVGFAVTTLGLGGLLLLATPLVSNTLLALLERNLPLVPSTADPPQAIVVLSAEIRRDGSTDDFQPGPLSLERERAAAALSRQTGLPVLVTGGATAAGTQTLAAVMAKSLTDDFGTTIRWTEPRAEDTWENAIKSAAMLQAQHIHAIYLVTHAWHMRRALIAFAYTGIAVTAAPVRLDSFPTFAASDFIPRASAWLVSYYALHEWLGCADYTLRGR